MSIGQYNAQLTGLFAFTHNFLLFRQPQLNFSNHPVEMCPLDDNADTNTAAKNV